ncbi:MAG TPA: AMP-binding protein [Acidimicrobiales bacterium]|nr:AMP-binding protein [Acidimicrobiales bacterium]
MPLSFEEAQTRVIASGQRFAITTKDLDGRRTKVFENSPGSLRDLVDSARLRRDDTFLVYEDERWTFGDWIDAVDAFAAALVDAYGVARSDRVAIAMRNYPEWTVAWGAAISVGAIVVSLNAWGTADELEFALDDSTPRVVVADAERVERMAARCGERDIALVGVRLGDAVPDGVDRFEEVSIAGAAPQQGKIDIDDDATILYTSGTTGRPKGAVSSHRAVLSALLAFGARAAIERQRVVGNPEPTSSSAAGSSTSSSDGDAPAANVAAASGIVRPVFILIVPLFHVTGSVPVMLSCLSSGLKLVIMHHWDAERALELIEAEAVTNFVGVPTQSHDLVSSPRFADFDTSSLVSVGGGGAPTPAKLVQKVDDSFTKARPNIGYGMTETNSYGPGNSGDDYVTHPTSTGRLVAIADIEARDPDGNPLPNGATGELWMTGPHLIRGYWNRPDATAETIVDGWLRTGDIGHVDDDGFVYVSDRAKDMVLRGGENVYCAEVEDALYEHPGVHEAAVFGLPDDRLGEIVAAAVLPKPGVAVTEAELRTFVAGRLAAFKVPERIDVRTEPLPRNAAGKFLKRDLRTELVP